MIEDRSMIIDESCSKLIILPSTYFKSVNILVDVGKARCRFIGTDPKMPQAGAYMHQDPAQFWSRPQESAADNVQYPGSKRWWKAE